MKKLDPCPFFGEVPKGEWKQGQALPHLIVRHIDDDPIGYTQSQKECMEDPK